MYRLSIIIIIATVGCGSSQEAVEVELPVVVNASGMTQVTTDLGYTVTVTRFRTAIRDVELTVEGEMHASVWRTLGDLILPSAHAHPGHYAGGDVTGELKGSFVVDWTTDGVALGRARLLTGRYRGANFTFRRAGATDGLAAGDPLLGHTLEIEGTAARGGRTVRFTAVVDIDDGAQMVGAPFDLDLRPETQATLGLEALTQDPFEPDTLFDKLDFLAADADGDGQLAIVPGQDIHNVLKRNVQVHDQYRVVSQ